MYKPNFAHFAAYNAWANTLIYDAAASVSQDTFTHDIGAFFGSLSGTLNHIIIADRIWLRRMSGDGPVETQLDRRVTNDLAELRAARIAEDARIAEFVETRHEADFAADLSYHTTSGEPFTQPLNLVLAHFFNHQTHHRGQAHGILTQLSVSAPSIDLLYYLRSLDE